MDLLTNYISNEMQQIEGWCNPNIFKLITAVEPSLQGSGAINGVGEIGVHHGKFFIGLKKLRPKQSAYAVDLFDDQEKNIDRSGKGSLEKFKENLSAYCPSPENVEILSADSFGLGVCDIQKMRERHGTFSYFSIDGGHTVAHTIKDYFTAEAVTDPNGIIFIDDYYSQDWPGVQEGIAKLFLTQNPTFVPLCFGFKKMMLVGISQHERYLKAMYETIHKQRPEFRCKLVDCYGWKSLSVSLA